MIRHASSYPRTSSDVSSTQRNAFTPGGGFTSRASTAPHGNFRNAALADVTANAVPRQRHDEPRPANFDQRRPGRLVMVSPHLQLVAFLQPRRAHHVVQRTFTTTGVQNSPLQLGRADHPARPLLKQMAVNLEI